MFCRNCGKVMAEGKAFCPFCGAQVVSAPPVPPPVVPAFAPPVNTAVQSGKPARGLSMKLNAIAMVGMILVITGAATAWIDSIAIGLIVMAVGLVVVVVGVVTSWRTTSKL